MTVITFSREAHSGTRDLARRLAEADGTKDDLAENSLLAEYSIRYGGYGGMAYHLTERGGLSSPSVASCS